MALPGVISYCKITGLFLEATADTSGDPDDLPQGNPLVGATVTFRAAPSAVRTSSPAATTIPREFVCQTDASGYLYSPGVTLGEDGNAPSDKRFLYILASDDPDIEPHNWSWYFKVYRDDLPTISGSFIAHADAEIDLATVVQVPASPGAETAAWIAAVSAAQSARDAAQSAASDAAGSAADAEAARDLAVEAAAHPSDPAVAALIDDPDSQVRASLSSTYALLASMGVVTLGDSRMARDGSVDGVANVGETAVYNSDRGIFTWANTILRKRFAHLSNGGVGSNTVAQMLARIDGLLAYNPGWLVGFGHINSVGANLSATAIIADLSSIFDKVAGSGVRIVWGTDWPASTSTTQQRAVLYAVNEWLRSQATVRRGFSLVDFQSVVVNPGTGNMLPVYATDGLHQESAGALALGQELASVLGALTPRSDRLIASNDDPTNMLANGMMVGNSGGTAPSWGANAVTLTGVRTKVARTDGFPGEWQQSTVTGSSGWYHFYQQVNSGGAIAAGDRVRFECEFETDASGWSASKFGGYVSIHGSFPAGTITNAFDHMHVAGAALSANRVTAGVFRTPPISIPNGFTDVHAGILLEEGGGTFRIARARLYKV